ncbi:hypothetical protein GCM10009678_42790 [Actinomadura kijaniata]|uniref:DUF397 domain-containing protein n=1 Tax=Actinomadura kijaniata TaxID=46161 RepID=UPI001601A014|nr:DUF397 domain-containing protein [Actinomadura namibiensis]
MDLRSAPWRKASRSHEEGDACIEVASAPGIVAIRDSKNPDGSEVIIDHEEARTFSRIIKSL